MHLFFTTCYLADTDIRVQLIGFGPTPTGSNRSIRLPSAITATSRTPTTTSYSSKMMTSFTAAAGSTHTPSRHGNHHLGALRRTRTQGLREEPRDHYPGLAQRMFAGRSIWHSEMNNSSNDDAHFVQMRLRPDCESIDPDYQRLDINTELDLGGSVPTASGKGHDAAI